MDVSHSRKTVKAAAVIKLKHKFTVIFAIPVNTVRTSGEVFLQQ